MPDAVAAGLFRAPLRVVGQPASVDFPDGWSLRQVVMPERDGVDALAAAPSWGATDDVVAAAVRHWCGEDLGQLEIRSATTAGVRDEGPALGLDDLALHDPALHDVPGCPLVRVDDDTPLLWTRATRHRAGSDAVTGWVPFGQAVVRWLDRDPTQPVAHTMSMAGLGAATSFDDAVELACCDVVAQDAVMAWWMSGSDTADSLAPPARLRTAWEGSPLDLRLRALPAVGGSAVLAVALDAERGLATLGAAVGPEAPWEASGRALWQLTVARDLASPTGTLGPHVNPGLLPGRADRDYLAAAGPGLRRAVDPLSAVQLGLDPLLVDRVRARTAPGGPATVPSTEPAREALLQTSHDVWVVDLTTPDVAAAGWHCTRVLVPALQRIPVPAFPLDLRSAERLPYPGW